MSEILRGSKRKKLWRRFAPNWRVLMRNTRPENSTDCCVSWDSGIEAITPEACRQHFLKISGEPNDPPLNVAKQVPQQQVSTELDREPTFEEFVKTLHEMKVSAPGDDEITVDMIETAPIPIPIQGCILRLLGKCGKRRTMKEHSSGSAQSGCIDAVQTKR